MKDRRVGYKKCPVQTRLNQFDFSGFSFHHFLMLTPGACGVKTMNRLVAGFSAWFKNALLMVTQKTAIAPHF
jgi:hypothetical protein